MDKKVNTNHKPTYPLIRELLKKKMKMKRVAPASQQSESNVEQNHGNGNPAKRGKIDANLNRREEKPGTSRTSARSEPSSGDSSKTIAAQTSSGPSTSSCGDGSEVGKIPDKEKKNFSSTRKFF